MMPMTTPTPISSQAAAQEPGDGAGCEREGRHQEHVAVRRGGGLDLVDAGEAVLGRHGAAHDVGHHLVEPGEVRQADRAGLDPEQVRLLVAQGAERSVDGSRRRENLGKRQPELFGEPGHDPFETAGGEAGAVECASHAEHELDGVR